MIEGEDKWGSWFSARPCKEGWDRFAHSLRFGGLLYAVRTANFQDVAWGALHTHRPIMLAAIATERNEPQVLWLVTQNPHVTQGVLEYLSLYNEPLVSEAARKALNDFLAE